MQVVLFLLFVILVILLVSVKHDALTKGAKIGIAVGVSLLLLVMYFYESSLSNSTAYNRQIVNAYRQGKTLTCNEYKVNKETFIYVSGTQTFMPSDGQENLGGVIIKASTCKIGL